ncbi:MAG: ComEC/Rec2 family competence protein [Actinomycetota bacterium]|nr:ComEC/Rec2 family competence protein [Actinomycetota bacterium]
MIVDHPALPPAVSRPWLIVAVAAWCLAVAITALNRPAPIPPGPFEGQGVFLTDPVNGRFGEWALIKTEAGVLLADLPDSSGGFRGAAVWLSGEIEGEPGTRQSIGFRARLDVTEITESASRPPPHIRFGQALRDRVIDRLQPLREGRALLAGFLIGDTSGVARSDIEAMRRSGLSHFVAVSGSNVALFLGLLFVAAGPAALGPKRRAIIGLLGLPVYAAATRFEPSVMRASVMAALALGGRLIGVVFEAWQLLSLAVVILLVASPNLVSSVGFQLSVAATAGVLVGARWPVEGKLQRALAVTAGAQVAVAPIILIHFESVPLLSPLANLLAAPVVAAATVVGAVGVALFNPLTSVAVWMANLVLWLSRGVSVWPQVGAAGVGLTIAMVMVVLWRPRWRPMLLMASAVAVLVLTLMPDRRLPDVGAIVLDVGQGDAILLHGGSGHFALIDGGPDPLILMDRLRSYGVDSLDLVAISHVHADHITGLTGLLGQVSIGQVWASLAPHETGSSVDFMMGLGEWAIPVEAPPPGRTMQLGSLRITVEAPLRRYSSPNDQSLVLSVEGPASSMLLAGDIETFAQADLGHLRTDVLKVPHQGGATSDPEWLAGVEARLAVISVGPNSFGHPAEWVIDVLEDSGAEVVRTDETGDVVVPLG